MNTQLAFDLWRYANMSLIRLTEQGTKALEKRANKALQSINSVKLCEKELIKVDRF